MKIPNSLTMAVAAVILFTTTTSVSAATAAGAGIELNGKYVGGYTITWDGESREDLALQLSKHDITFERDFRIPVDADDPTSATLRGEIRILSKIRGDRQVMATATVLRFVKRDGKWYAEARSLQRAFRNAATESRARPTAEDYSRRYKEYTAPKPEKDPKTGFVVGGKNSSELIKGLKEINGIPIPELEQAMRPKGLSNVGFLGKDGGLLEVMAADN